MWEAKLGQGISVFCKRTNAYYYQIDSQTSTISIAESSQPDDGAVDTRAIDSDFRPTKQRTKRVPKSGGKVSMTINDESRHLTSSIIDLE